VTDKYILDGKTPIPEPDLLRWALWFEKADRVVAQTRTGSGILISTVFIGINHRFGPGPPLLFETMAFDDYDEINAVVGLEQRHYSTWAEAEEGHHQTVDAYEAWAKARALTDPCG
jgi:hypothetical protein